MKLCIETAETCDCEELRTLIIDAAEQLLGTGNTLLEAKLPWDGHPVMFADAEGHPVLVSFDPEQSQAALLNGLKTSEQLSNALPWVNQVYEALGNQQLPVRLIIVSQDYPPGCETILSDCPQLTLYRYRTLSINGETGLWLEQANSPPVNTSTGNAAPRAISESTPSAVPAEPASPPLTTGNELPPLSDEESAFFQQL
ncbi:hypothetical protein DFR30_2498 [Thiogranum longum]|uniref:Uncharacterized protein n=1 Tax=Thiogranum longum TaxID=1537524 RepID=A0A4R1HEP8_9GAMM|nr:hypothetical protein [Thiogranum longum]TCK19201.1 hypothetical protein DFR30_2498 [Thiogranum longum]